MLVVVSSMVKSGAALQLENVALRHQIGALRRSEKKRLALNNADRLFWIGVSRVWADWRSALMIVKPDPVLACIGRHSRSSGPGKFGEASQNGRRSRRTFARSYGAWARESGMGCTTYSRRL